MHCNTGILSQKINPTDLPAVLMDYLGINIPARATDFIVIILFIILSFIYHFTVILLGWSTMMTLSWQALCRGKNPFFPHQSIYYPHYL